MKDVFIVSAVRTPVGKRNGYLREWMAPNLLAKIIDEVIGRIDLDPNLVEDIINGTVYQIGEQGFTLGRVAALLSRLPETVPGISLNRQCGSSLSAIQMAYAMIVSGIHDVLIASGCEMMTKYFITSDMNGTLANGKPMGHPFGREFLKKHGMPDQMSGAQMIADKWGITKSQCDEFAISSHEKALNATEKGYFKTEILPVDGLDKEGNRILRDTDETMRAGLSMEQMATLEPLPNTKWITAGLSSTITDGASAVVLMSEEKVRELNITPLARIVDNTVVGTEPIMMLTGPIPATRKVLKKSGMKMNDIDIFEVNEAFAPIPLAWAKELDADMDKLNVNGGAMALGHPVGNSGCRLTVTALYELIRREKRNALVTLCTGGGMAPATIFERA